MKIVNVLLLCGANRPSLGRSPLDGNGMMLGFMSSMSGSLLTGLARVSFTGTLGDDDTSIADRVLALVTLHQMLTVLVTLFADWPTTIFFSAAVAYNSRAESAGFLLAGGVTAASAVLLGDLGGGYCGFLTHGV
ncbi:MAG: hypothetical protein J3R72DRAFT_458470 [Linnemannia gamsii]|nr:MAG: hypothetical protein J3R72DRAFT_458470 [Linnemannia gamsii]